MNHKTPENNGRRQPYDLPPVSRPVDRARLRRVMVRWFTVGLFVGIVMTLLIDRVMAEPATVRQNVYAIDGDTIVVNGTHMRLFGIDAPELAQTCSGQAVGQMAKARMIELVKAGNVRCQPKSKDRYGRTIAICYVDGSDLGQIMVSEGLAFAYRRYSQAYVPFEHAGPVHQFACINPETYRHSQPQDWKHPH